VSTGWKLAIGGLLIVGLTTYMAYVGASASWQYYMTVDEFASNAPPLAGHRVRVSGKVTPGTLHIAADRRQADFTLQGASASLPVVCSGTLPDNLADDIDVVVEGRVDESGMLRGDKILTRCADKYAKKTLAAASPQTASSTGRGDP
jgi:cytochrome c-type biogenesis protein CcmE